MSFLAPSSSAGTRAHTHWSGSFGHSAAKVYRLVVRLWATYEPPGFHRCGWLRAWHGLCPASPTLRRSLGWLLEISARLERLPPASTNALHPGSRDLLMARPSWTLWGDGFKKVEKWPFVVQWLCALLPFFLWFRRLFWPLPFPLITGRLLLSTEQI